MARTGWLAGPVRPESAVLPPRHDPLLLGRFTFAFRWPRTRRLLTTEFELSRDQAWTVAWTARRHRGLARQRLRLQLRLLLTGLLLLPPLAVFVLVPIAESFVASTVSSRTGGPVLPWALGAAGVLSLLGIITWVLYERYAEDRLIERIIRRCWRDQECIWCGQDMEEARPGGDRWAVCPECGMRSPVAVRSP